MHFSLKFYLAPKYAHHSMEMISNDTQVCGRTDFFVDYHAKHVHGDFDEFLNTISAGLNSTNSICYVAVAVLGIAIIRFLRKHRNSAQNTKLQRQINIALTVQTAIPFLLVGVRSISSRLLMTFIGNHSAAFRNYLDVMTFWIPLTNPIIAIWFIRPYREATFMFFRGQNYVQSLKSDQ
ncbi:hypothetical protein M3Y97_00951800 [Aphelenchoides bicaudatus]|nr:hypothetical protein M3Y97_00951800 [Aphelenchoides bicaudatus]